MTVSAYVRHERSSRCACWYASTEAWHRLGQARTPNGMALIILTTMVRNAMRTAFMCSPLSRFRVDERQLFSMPNLDRTALYQRLCRRLMRNTSMTCSRLDVSKHALSCDPEVVRWSNCLYPRLMAARRRGAVVSSYRQFRGSPLRGEPNATDTDPGAPVRMSGGLEIF